MKNIKFTLVLLALFVGQTAGATIAIVDTPVASTPALRLGSTGGAVTSLQMQLKEMADVYPEGLVTGYFGALTEKAVKKLQAKNNLEQVGVVGPKTRELLLKLSKESKLVGMVTTPKVYEVPMVNVVEHIASGATNGYVFYTTNKLTASTMWYGPSTPLDTNTAMKVTDSTMTFSHSHNLYGLATSTNYYYIIKVTDEKGNSATTTEKFFKTLGI